ncbi:tetratricopeptide repeat protein [Streptomyces sp. NPDC051243]|uniref:tetratricopeptide repeat protein n=1 Tax=Streptomyces sp. NPDC051243 TaxID=3365646 RepID=UPI0037A20907
MPRPGTEAAYVLAAHGGVAAHYVAGGIHHHYTPAAAELTALGNWQPVSQIELLGLGVHRARAGESDGSALPPYVLRDVDSQVRTELRRAAETGGLVLLTGDSTAGKSRTALEAVRAVLPGHVLLAPPSGADLRPLRRAPGEPGYDRHVLWLDDLEHYLGPGCLEPSLLTSLSRAGLVVLATLRDERYDTLREAADGFSGDGGPNRMAAETGLRVLNMVEPIAVRRLWSDAELARVAQMNDSRLNEAHGRHGTHGIAEYLAAGPELLGEWRRAERATAKGGHPRGAALVAAAVDLAHIGLIGDLPEALLREAHEAYLRALGGSVLRPESYAEALEWASQVRYGVASLLMEGEQEGTKRPFDYLVDSVARDPEVPDPPDSMWLTALKYADDRTRQVIAWTATFSGRWAIAEQALKPLAEAGVEEAVINYTFAQLLQRADPAEVEPLLRPLAEAGSPLAQLNLAGVLKMQNADDEAERWWLAAAEAGVSIASYSLFMHLRTKGDDEQAERWLRRAAEDGYVEAMTTLATLLHKRGDEAEAEPWWREAAIAGDPQAMYVHGHLLRLRGNDEAEMWLRRAAEQGHDTAAEILGRAADGRGDLADAERWWRMAAEAGNLEAANQLGVLLSTRGERAEGATWYAKGAEGGHEVAMFNLAEWLFDEGDVEAAKDWHRRAGEAGNSESLNNLGNLLRQEGDLAAAEVALRRAADSGDVLGCLNLIDLLISEERPEEAQPLLLGLLSDPDSAEAALTFAERLRSAGRPQTARTILHWAAEAGRPDAAHNLGLHYYAAGLAEDAERWWRVAAPRIPASSYNVGSLLSKRDEDEEAASWWRRAAEAGHRRASLKLAAWLIDSGAPDEAEERLRQLADEFSEAAFLLGLLLFDKPGDHTEAEYWLQRGEEHADADEAFQYASYFAQREDEENTERWCRTAAEAGHPRAALNLGVLLARRGQLAQAEPWLVEAVHRGLEEAAEPLTQVREFLAAQQSP